MSGAPLVSIPGAPTPPGGQAEWFKGADGADLRAALFPAKGAPRGSIVLSGGRTEPIEKYFEFIDELTGKGYVVLAHDWRGQGLSHRELPDRLAGHARGYDAFLTDYRALLAKYEAQLPKPWFAIGHSMGGCLTLLALARGEAPRFFGAILSAPMLGIQLGGLPLPVARLLAGFNGLIGRAGAYVRAGGRAETFENNVLTHDRTRYERAKAQVTAHPDLDLGGPTWGWLDFALSATGYLARPENLQAVTIPVVIVSAERDRLVDNAAQRAVAANLPNGEFVSVPGAYHEILMETDTMRNIFLRALDALLGKAPPDQPSVAKGAESAPVVEPKPTPAAAAPAEAQPAPLAALAPEPKTETVVSAEASAPTKAQAKPKAAPKPKAAAPKPKAAPKPRAASAAKKTTAPKAVPKTAATSEPATKAPAARKVAAVKTPAPAKASAPKAVAKAATPKLPAKPASKPAAKTSAPKAVAPKAPAAKVAPKPTKAAAAKPAPAAKKASTAAPPAASKSARKPAKAKAAKPPAKT